VCSPTRSAALTGRTPNRDCITGAEGCGQKPAWSCGDSLPLSPRTFTIAEAAKKKGYATLHIG
jgi:arylsulfatase A-like enzyme